MRSALKLGCQLGVWAAVTARGYGGWWTGPEHHHYRGWTLLDSVGYILNIDTISWTALWSESRWPGFGQSLMHDNCFQHFLQCPSAHTANRKDAQPVAPVPTSPPSSTRQDAPGTEDRCAITSSSAVMETLYQEPLGYQAKCGSSTGARLQDRPL